MASLTFPSPTQLKNISDPTANSDAATKAYVDDAISGGGAGATNAAGNTSEVQFNNSNAFAASNNFTFNSATSVLTVTGNISANYFLGNGSQLTGISTSYISNGNSNVSIPAANGNVNISVAGNSNVVVITGSDLFASGNVSACGYVTANYFSGNGGGLTGLNANTSNYSNYAGNVVNAAQPNITSLGTLTGLTVSGDTTLTGNLTVSGTTTTVNSTITRIIDPIIELGGGANGAALTTNDGFFRGEILHYYNAQPVDAFIGWNTSNSEFTLASNVSVTDNTVTINQLGNIRADNFIGNGSQLTGISTSSISNGTSNVNIPVASGNVTVGVGGTANVLSVTSTGIAVVGNITGNYVFGNGSLLTGITVGTVINGTSNLNIPTVNGNINLSVGGTSNVVVITGTGENIAGYVTATGNVTGNYIIGNGAFLTGVDLLTVGNADIANSIANGNSNINTPVSNGNIAVSIAGVSNTVVFTSTGVNVAGYVTATGNITGNYIKGNGSLLTGVDTLTVGGADQANYISNGTSNVNTPVLNGNITVSINGTANTVVFTNTGVNVAGYVTATGNVTGNYFIGNGSLLTGVAKATSADSVSNGTSNVNILTANGNVTVSVNSTSNVAVFSSTGLTVSGNISVSGGNVDAGVNYLKGNGYYITDIDAGTANIANSIQVGNTIIAVPVANGNVTFQVGGIANVLTISNSTMNLISTGTANLGNAVRANYFIGNGSLLTGLTSAGVANGTSNISIPVVNGNVNISAAGNANVVSVSGNAVTVAGNVTATSFLGDGSQLTGIASGNYANFAGNVVNSSQPNITSLGTLVSLTVTGTTTSGSGNITASTVSTSTTTGALKVAGGVGVVGNLYVGGIINANSNVTIANRLSVTATDVSSNTTTGALVVSGGIGASGNLNISGIINSTGDSNLGNSVTANYFLGDGGLLSNISATATGVTATEATTGTYYLRFVNAVSGTTASYGNTNLTFDAATGNLSTTLITATTGSITGNLTTGNANLGNLTRSNYFSGSGNLLSNIQAGNITGTVATANYSIYSGTVLTNAQPNITSVGTLTTLTVGNATSNTTFGNGTISATGNITASYYFGNGSQLTGIASAGNANISAQQALNVATTGTYYMLFGNVATGNTYVFSNANVTFDSNTGNLISTFLSGTIQTATQPNIATIGNATSNHSTLGNVIALTGNSIYLNGTTTTATQTPIFNIGAGANGAALASNDSKDRGVSISYFSGAATTAFMGWKNANSEFVFASAATIASQVVTVSSLGNIRAGNANLGNAATANYLFGTLGTFGAQPNITGVGTLSSLTVTGNITSGNASLGNAVTANYFIGDGSLLTNIGTPYSILNGNSNVVIASANANVNISVNNTANVVTVSNNKVTVSGNVEATYFIGNGSQLTGISGATSLINGNSNVIVNANSNVSVSVTGTSNVLVVANTGLVVTGNLSVSGISNLGNVGNVKITGGSSGQYLRTDGAGNLTWATVSGGGGGGGTSLAYTAGTTPPASGNNPGDQWFNTTTNALYTYIDDGTGQYWIDISTATYSGNSITSLDIADLSISGNVNLGNIANITLPGGSNGQVLTSNGSNGVSWTTPVNPRAAAMVMSLIFGG